MLQHVGKSHYRLNYVSNPPWNVWWHLCAMLFLQPSIIRFYGWTDLWLYMLGVSRPHNAIVICSSLDVCHLGFQIWIFAFYTAPNHLSDQFTKATNALDTFELHFAPPADMSGYWYTGTIRVNIVIGTRFCQKLWWRIIDLHEAMILQDAPLLSLLNGVLGPL